MNGLAKNGDTEWNTFSHIASIASQQEQIKAVVVSLHFIQRVSNIRVLNARVVSW